MVTSNPASSGIMLRTGVLSFLLLAVVCVCLRQVVPGKVSGRQLPAAGRRIDPLAMQMQAAILEFHDIQQVNQLLQRGVDINAPIGCGDYRPVDGAITTVNLPMLEFLLAHGAKLRDGELADVAFMGDPATAMAFAKVLIAHGADVNAMNRYSLPLTSAAYRDDQAVVKLLLAQPDIKVDAQDVDGYTALMWAARNGSADMVTLLLHAGANPNLKNQRGETTASIARQAGLNLSRLMASAAADSK